MLEAQHAWPHKLWERGTTAYLAPEALTGIVAPQGDLFSLGATLYEVVTGALPYGGTLDNDDRFGRQANILAGTLDVAPLRAFGDAFVAVMSGRPLP